MGIADQQTETRQTTAHALADALHQDFKFRVFWIREAVVTGRTVRPRHLGAIEEKEGTVDIQIAG